MWGSWNHTWNGIWMYVMVLHVTKMKGKIKIGVQSGMCENANEGKYICYYGGWTVKPEYTDPILSSIRTNISKKRLTMELMGMEVTEVKKEGRGFWKCWGMFI